MSSVLDKQPFAIRILKAHRAHDRIAHAYLMTGASDSTQEEMALAWACSLECESKSFQECHCTNCRQIHEASHPDVHWIGRDRKAKSIKIEEIRDILEASSLKPYAAPWKVFIVIQAERMTLEASNAFLKTLEEPPPHTVFILTAETKTSMLETIQSRAFEIRLFPEKDSSGLASNIFASLSGSSWVEALELWQELDRQELAGELERLGSGFHANFLSDQTAVKGTTTALIEAVDKTLEVRQAVLENVNVKLALTRLAMHLERMLPLENLK